jgi:acetylornithine deacetylase/succinyl-diaminopimelate desuccinylase-like protein
VLSPVIDTLASLVRINSVNSAYDGGPGEGQIAAWITRFFHQRGIKTWQQEVFPGRPNVLALLPGADSSRQIVLEDHMDTVSVQGMSIDQAHAAVEYVDIQQVEAACEFYQRLVVCYSP